MLIALGESPNVCVLLSSEKKKLFHISFQLPSGLVNNFSKLFSLLHYAVHQIPLLHSHLQKINYSHEFKRDRGYSQTL